MKQREVNALKALLKHCRDKNNARFELNGVLVSGNKLVCTDMKQLLALEFESKFTDESLISPVMLLEGTEDLVGVERPADYLDIIDKNGGIIDELGLRLFRIPGGYFPDFHKVFMKSTTGLKAKQIDDFFVETTFCECVHLAKSYFNPKQLLRFIEVAKRLHPENVVIKQVGKDTPLEIEGVFKVSDGEIGFKYVVLPIFL